MKEKILNFRVLFFCFISFFCAIIFGKNILSGDLFYISFFLIFGLILFVLALKRKQFTKIIGIFIAFVVGMGAYTLDISMFKGKEFVGVQTVQGQIDVVNTNSVVLKNVKINGNSEKNIVLKVYSKNFSLGQIIEFNAEIETMEPFELGKFNTTAYKFNSPYTTSVSSDDISILSQGKLSLAQNIRLRVKNILTNNLSKDDANLFYGIMFGDKSELDFDLKTSYQTSGISHLLAVSGLHVGVLIAFITYILNKTKLKYYVKFIIVSSILLLYCYLCSFSPSVVRASLMAIILLTSNMFGKQYDFVNSISLSGLLILAFSPLSAFDIGFQLSFLSVLSIAFIYPIIYKWLDKFLDKIKIPKNITTGLSLTLCIQLGLLPLTANYFGQVSLLSIFANIICIPLFEIAYIGIFVSTLICIPLSFMGFLYIPFKWITDFISLIASFVASSKEFIIKLYPLSFAGVLAYFIAVFILSRFVNMKKFAKSLIALGLVFVVILYGTLMALPTNDKNLTIYQNENFYHIIVSSKGKKLILCEDNEVPYNFTNKSRVYEIDYLVNTGSVTTEIESYYKISDKTKFGTDKTMGDFEVSYITLLNRVNIICIEVDGQTIYYLLNQLTAPEEELLSDTSYKVNIVINQNYSTLSFGDYRFFKTKLCYTNNTYNLENFCLKMENGKLNSIWSLN